MENVEFHLSQARINLKAAQANKRSFPDWSVTMCFYSALHLVEYYRKYHVEYNANNIASKTYVFKENEICQANQREPSPHFLRRTYIKILSKTIRGRDGRDLRQSYDYLEGESRYARYLPEVGRESRSRVPIHNRGRNANEYYAANRDKVATAFDCLNRIAEILEIEDF